MSLSLLSTSCKFYAGNDFYSMIRKAAPNKHCPPFEKGEVIGDYEITLLLSQGFLGDLYFAKHQANSSPVALEVMTDYFNSSIGLKKKAIIMLERSKRVASPYVLRLEDFQNVDGWFCMAYEPLGLRSLKSAADDFRSHEACLGLMRQVLRGLTALHAENLFIPNLNPNNILLDEANEAKLYGYGLFELMGSRQIKEILSLQMKDDLEVNSIAVLSGDADEENYKNPRYDLYALGCTLYWLITRSLPGDHYESVTVSQPQFPSEWDVVIRRLLGQDPEASYESCKDLLADMKTLMGGSFIKGAAIGNKTRGSKNSKQKVAKKFSTTQSALLLILLLFCGGAGYYFFVLSPGESDFASSDSFGSIYVDVYPLEENFQGLSITSYPAGTQVLIRGEKAWRPLPEGGASLIMEPLPSKITLKADGLPNVSLAIDVASPTPPEAWVAPWGHVEKDLTLQGLVGSQVSIWHGETQVAQFELKENSEQKSFLFLPESYKFVVEKAGYRTAELIYEVSQTAPEALDLGLEKFWVEVILPPLGEGETFTVNGKAVDDLQRLQQLTPDQSYQFQFMKKGHLPLSYEFTPQAGEVIRLGELIWIPNVGGIDIQLTPSLPAEEVTVAVGDKTFLLSEDIILPSGTHNLMITHEDYFPQSAQVDLFVGETATLKVIFSPRPAQVEVRLSSPRNFLVKDFATSQLLTPDENGVYELPAQQETTLLLEIADAYSVKKTLSLAANEKFILEVESVPLPAPEKEKSYRVPYTGLNLVWIPSGSFTMGSPKEERGRLPEEGPAYTVKMTAPFWLLRSEVTQADYERIMGKNPSIFQGASLPVTNVSWVDAMQFVELLNERERAVGRLPVGYVYRLPTEAEWEYAARAGTSTAFSTGEKLTESESNILPTADSAAENQFIGLEKNLPKKVESYAANPWGLFDMHGNVSEWTLDGWQSRLPKNEDGAWTSPTEGDFRVIRGGNATSVSTVARSAYRKKQNKEAEMELVGFRIALVKE